MISTLGGLFNLNHFDQSSRANDVIVIRHKDGSLHSTPFNVRFGRAQMWNYAGRVVQVEVNGELTSAVMKIGKGGETYWLQPTYGAFGGADKSSTTNTGKDVSATPAAANEATAAGTQNNNNNNNNNNSSSTASGAAGTATRQGSTAQSGLKGNEENPSLSVNAADLAQFSIHPESPPELPAAKTPPREEGSTNTAAPAAMNSTRPEHTTSNEHQRQHREESTTASPVTPAPRSSDAPSAAATTAETLTNLGAGVDAAAAAALDAASPLPPGSPDSTSSLPLLHRGDDGHLMVETRAIHSAEDVQEARLALQAMAAAEKSRRRLSKLLLKEDAFFLQSAEAEGQLGDDDEQEGGHATETAAEVTSPPPNGEAQARADAENGEAGGADKMTPAWDTETLRKAAEKAEGKADVTTSPAATAAAADGEEVEAQPPATSATAASTSTEAPAGQTIELDGEAAVPTTSLDPPAATASAEAAAGQHPSQSFPSGVQDASTPSVAQTAAAPALAAASDRRLPAPPIDDASSAGSRSGSTDSYKVEDPDDYFLEAIDADDYAAMYGEEELLKNVSFSSSVTSGVSIPDLGNGGSGSDVSRPSPLAKQGSADTVDMKLPKVEVHDSPLKPGTVVGKAGTHNTTPNAAAAVAPSAVSAGALKKSPAAAKREASTDEMAELLDSEGRVVHPTTAGPSTLSAGASGSGGGPYFTRTLIPVEADLWKLHLKDGVNKVRYLARKDKGEVVSISCNIFLWNWTDRLVVSDVDGTITKSDLLGHFYAMLGKGGDWTHPGICNLYSKIERNGYHMVYLTARSVSQINQTKSYLFTLQQDGVGLPLGPVLTAPQRFFTALTQEVSKQSHVFKIACLTSVRAAFPPHTKPFFAGFGNRYNDVISYDAVSIPTHKIFIIDPSSVLHVCLVKQTYRDLGHLVDVTFPPLKRKPVVLHAPRHPHHSRHTADGTGGQLGNNSAAAGVNAAGGAPRTSVERHAYARGLLHRSASASSSSMSSSSSSLSARSDSSDQLELGSVSSEVSMEEAATAAGTQGPPHSSHHHHHHHHHHKREGDSTSATTTAAAASAGAAGTATNTDATGGEEVPMRHASVAFSLADSIRVPAPGEESRVAARASSLQPTQAMSYADAARSRQAAHPLGTSQTSVALTSSPSSENRTAATEGASTAYTCFSGPASPYMLSSKERAAAEAAVPASTSAIVAAAAGLNAEALSGGVANLTTPFGGAADNTSARLPPQLQQAGSAALNSSTNSSNASVTAAPAAGPKYNYGQRVARVPVAANAAAAVAGHASGASGVGGSGGVGGAYATDMIVDDVEGEDEMPVDPDFSSFAYWRMDPRDLIAPAAKAAAVKPSTTAAAGATARKEEGKGKVLSPVASPGSAAPTQVGQRGRSGASLSTPQLQSLPQQEQKPSADSTKRSTDKATAGTGLASPVSSNSEIAAAVASTATDVGGAIDAHKAGAEAAKKAAAADKAQPQDPTRDTKQHDSDLAEALAATPEVRHRELLSSPITSPDKTEKDAVSASGNEAPAASSSVEDRKKKPTLTPLQETASTAGAASGAQKSTSTRRGFFSAFGFGRGQSNQTAPESPNTVKQRQFQEAAKKRSLAHPDAWEYYRAQDQQKQTGPNPLAKNSPSSA